MKKRIFDVCCAIVLLTLCSPVLLIVALLVRLSSEGPVLFLQTRVGRNGKLFTIYKFRSMYVHACPELHIVESGDPMVTPIGRFLRRSHLDELPQLWNVILGDMSMVGPRPVTPAIAIARTAEVKSYMDRHHVAPGITGLAQVRGRVWGQRKGHRSTHRLNMFYTTHHNICFDLRIMLQTLVTMTKLKGV